MKDSKYNGRKIKDKRTNNDLENITQKTKHRATRTSIKTGGERMYTGRVGSICSTCGTRIRMKKNMRDPF
jgi:hypothetical protein